MWTIDQILLLIIAIIAFIIMVVIISAASAARNAVLSVQGAVKGAVAKLGPNSDAFMNGVISDVSKANPQVGTALANIRDRAANYLKTGAPGPIVAA